MRTDHFRGSGASRGGRLALEKNKKGCGGNIRRITDRLSSFSRDPKVGSGEFRADRPMEKSGDVSEGGLGYKKKVAGINTVTPSINTL